jgi:hypothetical protein
MNKSMLAVLTDAERLLIAETEPAALALLDEDGAVGVHKRVRRARNKYMGLYRRGASARVSEKGARGTARPKNQRAALKAEAFEEALARVSRRLGVLASQTARQLRTERLAAAKGEATAKPTTNRAGRRATAASASRGKGRSVTETPVGDRGLRSPVREKNRAGTRASGSRKQAKRDGR